MPSPKGTTILIVEDEVSDYELAMLSLNMAGLWNRTHWARKAEEGLDFLYQRGKYEKEAQPGLVLVDVKLPGMDGVELMETIRKEPKFDMIPLIVMTDLNTPEEIQRFYVAGANSYIAKPININGFFVAVQRLMTRFPVELVFRGAQLAPARMS